MSNDVLNVDLELALSFEEVVSVGVGLSKLLFEGAPHPLEGLVVDGGLSGEVGTEKLVELEGGGGREECGDSGERFIEHYYLKFIE